MDNLNFSLNTLEWAAHNISMQLKDVVSKISVSDRTQEKLLEGKFSVAQAEKFAEITKVPFGALFLDAPPILYKPEVPDLRQKPNAEPLSELFYEVLKDIQNKQEWYTEFLQEHGAEELKFVGKFKDANFQEYRLVADDIRSTLNIAKIKRNSTNRDNYLKLLIERCEDAGILIFKNGVVKNASRKTLDVNEFRGFVLIDKYAPVIFLNGRDAPSALVFTLAHELAHIWLGISGVDDLDIYGNDPTEVLCNKIAAEVLVPEKEFLKYWNYFNEDLSEIAQHFYVSKLMIYRVALTHGKISKALYQKLHNFEFEKFKKQKDADTGGGNFINMVPGRNSPLLTKTIVNQALSGNILLRDAGKLLNVSPQNILKLGGF
ncbi:ImmA/IrrE family metallo-endopeptidase [Acinetobacter sp.]|uniref:ImmA/IrrE family metallo-endopeptidase n=1 Tax=Acinetobacter sp. TaxID=472 RepID=UPI0035B43A5E